jgi:anti-anti-sigma regulatory factor
MEVRKPGIIRRGWMLKITRAANEEVVFTLSGRMGAENIGELEKLISAETSGRRVVLDLKDLMLVDQDVVNFLRRSEVDSIQLKNCPAYIREWITGEVR